MSGIVIDCSLENKLRVPRILDFQPFLVAGMHVEITLQDLWMWDIYHYLHFFSLIVYF